MKRLWASWARARLNPFLAPDEKLVLAVPGMDSKGLGSAGGQIIAAVRGRVRSYVLGVTDRRVLLLERSPFAIRKVRVALDQPAEEIHLGVSAQGVTITSSQGTFRLESNLWWRREREQLERLIGQR